MFIEAVQCRHSFGLSCNLCGRVSVMSHNLCGRGRLCGEPKEHLHRRLVQV